MTKHLRFLFIGLLMASFIGSIPVSAAWAEPKGIIVLNEPGGSDYVGIVIDGSFADWNDKPISSVYWNPDQPITGSLFRDEDYVYLYIKMYWPSYSQFNGYQYSFTVDGTTKVFDIVPQGGSIGNGITAMEVRMSDGYKLTPGANAYVHRANGQADRMELRIPLTVFSSNPGNVVDITFRSSNLGNQVWAATGTPTLPFLIAGSGLAIAGAALLIRKRKRP